MRNSLGTRKALLSYVQYRELGALLPRRFDDSVTVCWGVEVAVATPIVLVSVLVPSEQGSYDDGRAAERACARAALAERGRRAQDAGEPAVRSLEHAQGVSYCL